MAVLREFLIRHARALFCVSLALTAAAALTVGCSSPAKSSKREPEPNEIALNQPSSPEVNPVYRAIASSMDPDRLESSFQKILAAPDPRKEMTNTVERVLRIYYRAESHLEEFDTKLDRVLANPGAHSENAMLLDGSYSKLIAAWILSEQTRATISHSYFRLLELTQANGSPSQDKAPEAFGSLGAKAVQTRKSLESAVNQFGLGADRAGMQSLYRDLLGTAQAFREQKLSAPSQQGLGGAASKDQFVQQIEEHAFSDGKSVRDFFRVNDSALSRKIERARGDIEISQEIEDLALDVNSHLVSLVSDLSRRPQSNLKIFPSADARGNINGGTFAIGRWALTYDDGPHATHTPAILSHLSRHSIPATFFWLAQHTDRMPSLVSRAKSLGMELANHSYTHANLPQTSDSALRREVVQSTSVQAANYGQAPELFRCPYGACGPTSGRIRTMIANSNMIHVFWNVDSLDWQDRNPMSIYQRVKKQMELQKRGIILFHDIHPQSVEASRMLIEDWQREIAAGRMRFLTVGDAIRELNSPRGMK